MKKSNILRRAFSLLLLLLICIGLSSCGGNLFEERYREPCVVFVDALIADDTDAAYATFAPDVTTHEQFQEFWQQAAPMFSGQGSYVLRQVGWNAQLTGELKTYKETYILRFDDSLKTYQISIMGAEGITGIVSFYVQEVSDAVVFGQENDAPVFLQILFGILSVAAIAFTVWMLIDCIRRPMAKKGWTLLLIVLGGITVGFTRGMKLSYKTNFALSLFFGTSSIIMDSELSTLQISVYIPIFAVAYFLIRKKIKPPAAPAAEFPAEANEEVARTDEPDEASQTVEEAQPDPQENGENPV